MSGTKKRPPAATPEADPSFVKRQASLMTHASVNAAGIIEEFSAAAFGRPGIDAIAESLIGKIDNVRDGSLKGCEAMLMAQALALQSMFMSLSRRAAAQDYLKQYETYLRLALKAQSQCRATMEALATIKNPPVVFARQANITNGPQQVNNGTTFPASTRAEEPQFAPNELLEHGHEQLLDARTPYGASSNDPTVATLVAVDRST